MSFLLYFAPCSHIFVEKDATFAIIPQDKLRSWEFDAKFFGNFGERLSLVNDELNKRLALLNDMTFTFNDIFEYFLWLCVFIFLLAMFILIYYIIYLCYFLMIKNVNLSTMMNLYTDLN